jgi:hypothetical protein
MIPREREIEREIERERKRERDRKRDKYIKRERAKETDIESLNRDGENEKTILSLN